MSGRAFMPAKSDWIQNQLALQPFVKGSTENFQFLLNSAKSLPESYTKSKNPVELYFQSSVVPRITFTIAQAMPPIGNTAHDGCQILNTKPISKNTAAQQSIIVAQIFFDSV